MSNLFYNLINYFQNKFAIAQKINLLLHKLTKIYFPFLL